MSHCGPTREGNPGWGRFPAGASCRLFRFRVSNCSGEGLGCFLVGNLGCAPRYTPHAPTLRPTCTHPARLGKLRLEKKECAPGGTKGGRVSRKEGVLEGHAPTASS